MLRVPEPRPREAGAAGQSKPLTSFFIQDILRDGAERRGGHTGSPQPPCQPDARRELEPEPEGGRGGAGAPEDEWGARPRAAQEADKPAASEPGEAAGLGQGAVPQEGRAGLGAARARGRVRGGTGAAPAVGMRGPAATGQGTPPPPAAGAPRKLTPSPAVRAAQGFCMGWTRRARRSQPRGLWRPGLPCERAHRVPSPRVPDENPATRSQPPRDPRSAPAPHCLLAVTITTI